MLLIRHAPCAMRFATARRSVAGMHAFISELFSWLAGRFRLNQILEFARVRKLLNEDARQTGFQLSAKRVRIRYRFALNDQF